MCIYRNFVLCQEQNFHRICFRGEYPAWCGHFGLGNCPHCHNDCSFQEVHWEQKESICWRATQNRERNHQKYDYRNCTVYTVCLATYDNLGGWDFFYSFKRSSCKIISIFGIKFQHVNLTFRYSLALSMSLKPKCSLYLESSRRCLIWSSIQSICLYSTYSTRSFKMVSIIMCWWKRDQTEMECRKSRFLAQNL